MHVVCRFWLLKNQTEGIKNIYVAVKISRQHTFEVSPPHVRAASRVPLYVRVGVSPHLCLLIGRVVAHAAVQRERAVLPLAVFGHVTLEEGASVCLKPTHVAPAGTGVCYR